MALDALFDDPRQQGLLALGLGLLNSRGTFGQGLGQAGQQAMGVMQQAREQQRLRGMQDIQQQMAQMQLQNAQREAAKQQQLETLRGQFTRTPTQSALAGGGGPTVANAGKLESAQPGFDFAGYSDALAGVDPAAALAMKASLRKEQSKLSKLEPMRDPATGQLVNVAVYEDGTTKVLPFGVKPDLMLQNLGNRVVSLDKNAVPAGQSFALGVSPDAVLSANTSRANNAATIAAEDRRAAQGMTYQTDGDGNIIGLPSKVAPGQPVRGLLVMGTDGKPMQGKGKDPSESELTASGFASRMTEATKLLDRFESSGKATAGTQTAGAVPFVGGLIQRSVMTPEQQQYQQASRDWIRAKLRKESGAAIGADEEANEYATYFPMPGDSTEVIAQKRQARAIANKAMQQAGGRAFKQASSGAPSDAGKQVKRTGMYQGRKVVEYTDGSVDYAD